MSKLINLSYVSTLLTGNRTQITRNYNQNKYSPEFNYLMNFEKDWEKGIYHYKFLTEKGTINHDLNIATSMYADIELNIQTSKVIHVYIYVEKEAIFTMKDFEILWKGGAIKEIQINFTNKTLKLL